MGTLWNHVTRSSLRVAPAEKGRRALSELKPSVVSHISFRHYSVSYALRKKGEMQPYQFENSTANSGAAASAWFSRPISPLLAQTSVSTASKSGSLLTLITTMLWKNRPPASSSRLGPRARLGRAPLLQHFSAFFLSASLSSSSLFSVSQCSALCWGGKLARDTGNCQLLFQNKVHLARCTVCKRI